MRNLEQFYVDLPGVSAPKSEFIDRVAARCKVETTTVRNWIKGKTTPVEEIYWDILAEETGIPREQLFQEVTTEQPDAV